MNQSNSNNKDLLQYLNFNYKGLNNGKSKKEKSLLLAIPFPIQNLMANAKYDQ